MAEKMDSEREAFEKWARSRHMSVAKQGSGLGEGNYVEDDTGDAWEGWQARAHLTQPAQAVDDALVEEAIEAFDGKLLETYPDSSFHKLGEGDKAVVRASMRAAITRALAGEQAGWRLVPAEPTEGMCDAGAREAHAVTCKTNGPRTLAQYMDPKYMRENHEFARLVLRAGIAASPTPDKETQR